MKHNKIALSIALCLGVTSFGLIMANSPQTETTEKDCTCKELLIMAKNQLDAIDFTLEEFAFAVNSGSIKVTDKKLIREYVAKLRSYINKAKASNPNINDLININETLLTHIQKNLSKGHDSVFSLDDAAFKAKTEGANDHCHGLIFSKFECDAIKKRLKENEKLLGDFREKFKVIGQTIINRGSKKVEQVGKSINLSKWSVRLLPWALIGAYAYYTSRPTMNSAQSASLENSGPGKPGTPETASSGKVVTSNPTKSVAGNNLWVPRFVEWKEGTLLSLSLASLVNAKDDLKDLGNWSLKQANKFFAYLKGEPFVDGALIKKPKFKFKDVLGLEPIKKEFTKVLDYFRTKDSLDRSGNPVDKGYLLVGPIDSGKKIANALAGEITEEFTKQNKKTVCGTCTIHASSLISKPLKDVVKEAEESTPCVIVIDELDWLANQNNLDSKIWADVVTTLSSVIGNPKKQIFFVITATNIVGIDSAVKDLIKNANILYFENPSAAERRNFIISELSNRSISTVSFNIDSFVEQTDGCSITQLNSILARTFALAHSNQEIIQQKHIEQSINEIIHGISHEAAPLSATQKELLAAQFAGKALAHTLLAPEAKLLKVTIRPTMKQQQIEFGTIVKHKQYNLGLFATQDNIKKECVIELAGLVAQKILLDRVSQEMVNSTNKLVIGEIKKLIFDGISTKELTKSAKEDKKALVAKMLADFTTEATQLLTANRKKLESIAAALKDKLLINASDIAGL